jgi:hypothetical protein
MMSKHSVFVIPAETVKDITQEIKTKTEATT